MPDLSLLVTLLELVVKDRTQLALENIALRDQPAVYKRSVKRPNIKDGDRALRRSSRPKDRELPSHARAYARRALSPVGFVRMRVA